MLSLFDWEQTNLNIYLQWDYIYSSSWSTCNIPNVFIKRYFCQEQSKSRLKCLIFKKGPTKFKKI